MHHSINVRLDAYSRRSTCPTCNHAGADDPEEGEEGELSDNPEALTSSTPIAHNAEAMEVDTDVAEQGETAYELHCRKMLCQAAMPCYAVLCHAVLCCAVP